MADKKPRKFGDKAARKYGSGVSMSKILSDDEEGRAPDDDEKNDSPSETKVESRKTAKPQKRSAENEVKSSAETSEPVADEQDAASFQEETPKEKVEHTERHFFYFTEELTDEMIDFMRAQKPREKNKNRFMRVLLHMFFDQSAEKQETLYREALEKFKDKVG